MKKLSIEKKAKAYDEAIERAKNFIENGDETERTIAESIFAGIMEESEESEDKRVKKAIKYGLDYVFTNNTTVYETTKEQCLAWLEKQGSEPNWCHHKVDLSDCSEEYRKAYYDGWNNCNQQHAQLEAEQKPTEVRTTGYWNVQDIEQKPAVWSEEDEKWWKVIIQMGLTEAAIDWIRTLIHRATLQPKQEWSEEDEEAINLACSILYSNFNENENFDKSQMCVGEIIEKLKSLKDRVQLQPVQEWNGGDDAHIHSIITHLQDFIESHPNTNGADIQGENVAWLKSLKDRFTWKPSKEQIIALRWVLNNIPYNKYKEEINGLLEQLNNFEL